jgi:parallel beta-helix repeat protein
VTHEAFLSYSTRDESAARALCAALERRGIGVWMAPRDILPGLSWTASITHGIDNAGVMVLVYSSAANASEHIEREVQYALEIKLKVVPFRIEDIRPRDSFAFTIGNVQWLDAFSPPMEPHYDRLAKVLRQIAIARPSDALIPSDTDRRPLPEPSGEAERPNVSAKPPTHIVDFLRGPYYKLAEAIAAADAGDRILVRPGTYEERVVLDKALEIINEGKTDEVIIQANGANALAFRTERGRVVNITLRQRGGGNYSAVDIAQGRLHLEDCHIESDSLAGIAVHGTKTDPVIRNNRISRCLKSGVVVFDGARATLEKNDIAENNAFGVVIRDGANPVLRSNLIHGNELGGVSVDGGMGRIEDNTISDNRGEGVLVANEANPDLQRNKIFGNGRAGIYVYDRGASTVCDNKIFDNHNSGIAIRTEANPIIQKNLISGNNGKGVWCSDRAAGVVENNDLRKNNFGAFWKSDDCTTRYAGNNE